MIDEAQSPQVIRSKHCQDVLIDDHQFSISIVFSDAHSGWSLEVIDEHSMVHGWAMVFDTDDKALEAATIAF